MKDRACNAEQVSASRPCRTMRSMFDQQHCLAACAAASSPPVLAVSPCVQTADHARHRRVADLSSPPPADPPWGFPNNAHQAWRGCRTKRAAMLWAATKQAASPMLP